MDEKWSRCGWFLVALEGQNQGHRHREMVKGVQGMKIVNRTGGY